MDQILPYEQAYKERTHKTHFERDLPHIKDPSKSVDVILLGDSHFERLLWYGNLKASLPDNVFVPSVGGDRVEHLLYRLESQDGLLHNLAQRNPQPRKIILMVGGNNLNRNGVNDDVVQRVAATVQHIVERIQTSLPRTELHLWMIPPQKAPSKIWESYAEALSRIGPAVTYSQELYDHMNRLGPSKLLLGDGHINETGYTTCVLPLIQSLVSQK